MRLHLISFLLLAGLLAACSGSDAAVESTVVSGSSATSVADTDTANSDSANSNSANSDTANSDSSDDASTTGDADEAADSPDPVSDDESGSSDADSPAMAASTPLGAFFSDDGGFEAAIDEYTVRVEEQVVRCMAEQGFEFKPSGRPENDVIERQNELTRDEWTQEYGYGISTSFDSFVQQQGNDPNGEIIFSMGQAERELWFETLLGVGYDDPARAEQGAVPLEEQGCIGQALIATGGQGAIEGLESFGEAYEEGEEAIFDQNEVIVATGEWTRCLSEAGYPGFSEHDDPETSIQDRLDELTAPLNEAIEALDPEEGQALIAGDTIELEALPGLDVDALRALQAEEVELAVTDLGCYDAHVKEILEPLFEAFELGLMDTYASELDALKNIGS